MNMKEAFEIYFNNLIYGYKKEYGTYPKTVYLKQCDMKGIYISGTLNSEGYAEWQPVLQDEPIIFEDLESELGFKIHPDIKKYFTIFWFMLLAGNRGDEQYCLVSIEPNINIKELVKRCYKNGDIEYMKPGVYCAIGDADIDGNQDCGIYVNNSTGEVIGVDWDKAGYYDFEKPFSETSFKVANSLMELIRDLQW